MAKNNILALTAFGFALFFGLSIDASASGTVPANFVGQFGPECVQQGGDVPCQWPIPDAYILQQFTLKNTSGFSSPMGCASNHQNYDLAGNSLPQSINSTLTQPSYAEGAPWIVPDATVLSWDVAMASQNIFGNLVTPPKNLSGTNTSAQVQVSGLFYPEEYWLYTVNGGGGNFISTFSESWYNIEGLGNALVGTQPNCYGVDQQNENNLISDGVSLTPAETIISPGTFFTSLQSLNSWLNGTDFSSEVTSFATASNMFIGGNRTWASMSIKPAISTSIIGTYPACALAFSPDGVKGCGFVYSPTQVHIEDSNVSLTATGIEQYSYFDSNGNRATASASSTVSGNWGHAIHLANWYCQAPYVNVFADAASGQNCNEWTTEYNGLPYCAHGNDIVSWCEPAGAVDCNCTDKNVPSDSRGEPFTASNGIQFETKTDYQSVVTPLLKIEREYTSVLPAIPPNASGIWKSLGNGVWRDYYNQYVQNNGTLNSITLFNHDGSIVTYHLNGTQYRAVGRKAYFTVWTQNGTNMGWQLNDTVTQYYNTNGNLVQMWGPGQGHVTISYNATGLIDHVTDAFGHTLQYFYDSSNRINKINGPLAGDTYLYGYDPTSGNLVNAYQDQTVATYQYSGNLLIGITDESNSPFTTITYYGNSVQSAGYTNGAYKYSMSLPGPWYNSIFNTVTGPLGDTETLTYTPVTINGVTSNLIQSSTKTCPTGCTPQTTSYTYDPQGRLATTTLPNSSITQYAYDSTTNSARPTSVTESFGTANAKTTTTTWNDTWGVPATVTEPGRTTVYTYDNYGNLTSKNITDSTINQNSVYQYAYTYNSDPTNPFITSITATGPRTDLTQSTVYAYYGLGNGNNSGNLNTVTDTAGNVTTYAGYDANGRVGTITDANGTVTTLTYYIQGWLKTKTVTVAGTTFESANYTYYPTGLLQQVNLNSGAQLNYTYDTAHRLTDIVDGAGNRIHYDLDNAGNTLEQRITDSTGVLTMLVDKVKLTLAFKLPDPYAEPPPTKAKTNSKAIVVGSQS